MGLEHVRSFVEHYLHLRICLRLLRSEAQILQRRRHRTAVPRMSSEIQRVNFGLAQDESYLLKIRLDFYSYSLKTKTRMGCE